MRFFAYKSKELNKAYRACVEYVKKCYREGNENRCLDIISSVSSFEYNINQFYASTELMDVVYDISRKHFGSSKSIQTKKDHIIFYDCLAYDNKGLTQQYISALASNPDIEMIYVHETVFPDDSNDIQELLKINGIHFLELGKESVWNKCLKLQQIVEEFTPSKILFHLTPHTVLPFLALTPYKQIEKYQINLTDHAFWLGDSRFFDKTIEFRDYGAKVSLEKRGFSINQIACLPYYPWTQDRPFEGFPIDVSGKKILFSGGSLYKIEGAGDTFLDIVKAILERNQDVVFFMAGFGNTDYLNSYIRRHNLSNRAHFLGNRRDINEVFKRIDVFLDTYPFNGGLMCQLSAINGKPLLVYKSHDAEEVVCTKRKEKFVFDSPLKLVEEATRLFSDQQYYHIRSTYFNNLISDSIDFNNRLSIILNGESSIAPSFDVNIDYEDFAQQYINRINSGTNGIDLELLLLRISPSLLNYKMLTNIAFNILLAVKKIRNYCKKQ